jgi:cytochrome P450
VILINRAADRDPREFDHPEAVDFERSGVRTLAFAVGPHRCVGSHLARLELRVLHEQMQARLPTYRLKEGTKVVSHGGNVAGVEELWLSWDT